MTDLSLHFSLVRSNDLQAFGEVLLQIFVVCSLKLERKMRQGSELV